jgi:hypothetical protein
MAPKRGQKSQKPKKSQPQKARSASTAVADVLPQNALPRDVLVRVFSLLPPGALAVTPGRVCRAWAAAKAEVWAAAQAAAAAAALARPADEDDDEYATFLREDDVRCHPWLPPWYTRRMYAHVPPHAKRTLLWGACFHGQLDALADFYAAERDRAWFTSADTGACSVAAGGGRIDVLKYLRRRGVEWEAQACSQAAEGGKLDTILFPKQQGCEWDARLCTVAARRGDLRILKAVRAHDEPCPWSEHACVAAAENRRFEVLDWLPPERLPLRRAHLRRGRRGRRPCHAPVRARARRPVGRVDVHGGGKGRAARDPEAPGRAGLPVQPDGVHGCRGRPARVHRVAGDLVAGAAALKSVSVGSASRFESKSQCF